MKELPVTDALLRQYLLGKVDDEERQRIETLFITDLLSKEKVLAAEQELIEAFLEDDLPSADRETFLSLYAASPAQRRKLRIVKSIKDFAVTQEKAAQSDQPAILVKIPWFSGILRKPWFLVPVAAAIIITVSSAGVWLNNRIERNRQHSAVEQELTGLNAPLRLREAPPQMLTIVLPPVSVRSAQAQTALTPRADTHVVELRLLWIHKETYSTYAAILERVGNAEQFVIRGLHAEDDGSNAIRLRLPARLLTRGLYKINLSGVGTDGALIPTEEYSLIVNG